MKKRRKNKELEELENDLLFYLEYYKNFPKHYQKRIADKEIKELEEKIKKKS